MDRLYLVETSFAAAGVVVGETGFVRETAPIYRWMKGKKWSKAKSWSRITRIREA